jgi:pimeloyl-ACP methyl ester carboxylesterase
VRELQIPVDGATLAVSYSPGEYATIVALQGAASGLRDHPLYRHLHSVLPVVDLGVATFDRRGEGESIGEPSRGNFALQARDALAVVEAIGAPVTGLWGFSQGGWVAPLAATMSPGVAFLILVASTGVTPAVQMMYATEQQITRAGYGQDVVGHALGLRRDLEAWIHDPNEADSGPLNARLFQARSEPWWPLAFLPEDVPGPRAREKWIAEMDFDPAPVFGDVRVPTLAFFGADDAWTPVQESVETWRRLRGAAVDVVVIEGASHELTTGDGQISPIYETTMIDWLRSVVTAQDRERSPA